MLERAPDLVLVHGDTTTALAASLAAYYRKIPVGHVEAGLRTRNRYSPFPEEMNRHLVDSLAVHHFAPTAWAADNLEREGIAAEKIVVTGNTAIDALRLTLERSRQRGADDFRHRAADLAGIVDRHSPIVLVTSHRRESFGIGLEGIGEALIDLTKRFENLAIIYPVHPNPDVRATVATVLAGNERIYLTDPLDYDVFCHLMVSSRLILTDSGGIQEEAPSLDKPVLVLRDTSERPEAVEAGAAGRRHPAKGDHRGGRRATDRFAGLCEDGRCNQPLRRRLCRTADRRTPHGARSDHRPRNHDSLPRLSGLMQRHEDSII